MKSDEEYTSYNMGGIFFFFKQKTAYEIGVRLVGSEMCIRDRTTRVSKCAVFPTRD